MMKKEPAKANKAKLDDWQVEDANRLKALFEKQDLSQGAFGLQFEIGTQGMVWQYLNAKRSLNLKAAKAFADGLNVRIGDFSPTLAEMAVEYAASSAATPPSQLVMNFTNLTGPEAALIMMYRQLSQEQQHELEHSANNMLTDSKPGNVSVSNPFGGKKPGKSKITEK
jgi:transcriptional regulator with XRE-family HTH domain